MGEFDSDLFEQMLQHQYNVGKIHLKVDDDLVILGVVSLILQLIDNNQDGFKDLISGFKYRAVSNSIEDVSPNIIIYCKPENLDVIGRIIFKNAQQFFLQNYRKFEVPRYSEPVTLEAVFQNNCPIYKTIGDSGFKIMIQRELRYFGIILESYFDLEHNFARPITKN